MNKKKITSLLTVLVILLNMFLPSFSFALETGKAELKVVPSKTEVKRGDEITVSVNLNTNSVEGITALQIYMYYDVNVLEPVGSPTRDLPIQSTAMFGDVGGTDTNQEEGYASFMWSTGDNTVKLNYNDSLFTTTFKVKEDATLGESTLEIKGDDAVAGLDPNTFEPVDTPYTVVNSSVNVVLPINSISLNKSTSELWVGETDPLTVIYDPTDATGKGVKWTSSDETVATVSTDGIVTAKGKGTATITATTTNGKTATCTVTVKQPVTGVTLNKTTLDLEKNATEILTATITPSNADGDKTITWTSTDTAVATVSADGTVTAKGKGTTTITATTANGKTATCTVTVGVPLKSISFVGEDEETVTEKTLNKNDTFNLSDLVVYNPEDTDADKTITWSSTNTAVATVSTDGIVTAVDAGEATITATTVNGKKATCKITVVIPLKSITIKDTTSIKCGQTEKLEVTYDPVDTTDDKTIIWSTSDETKVAVSTDGTLTAKAIGDATITAKTLNGKVATCVVTVLPVPLESITIKEQNITLNKGASQELTIIYTPENTTDDKTVTLNSSDTDVVTVEGKKITAVNAGTTTITATTADGKTATTNVTVVVPLNSIKIDASESGITLNRPDTVDLDVVYDPTDTTVDKTITWTSTDTTVAKVDENGVVTPIAPGTAYIKAKVAGKEASCKLTVKVPLEGINIKTETELLKGKYEELSVTYVPEDTTYEGTVTWESSKPEVATVDGNGKVTALKEGVATITASAEENGNTFTATCEVTVKEIKIDSIAIDAADFDLGIGREKQLNVNFYPENTTDDKTVTWASSNPEIATVDENGLVKALQEGTATITVTSGNKTDTVEVTVKEVPIESIEILVPTTVKVGEKLNIELKINPADATKQDGFTITSSNSNILEVDENGEVLVKSAGRAIITVEAENGVKNQIEITAENVETSDENLDEISSVSPKTGDIAIELFVGLMIISALGIAFILIKNKRK